MSNLAELGKLSSPKKQTRAVPRKQQKTLIMYQLPEVAQMLRILAAEQNNT
jgi:hypothetical protein